MTTFKTLYPDFEIFQSRIVDNILQDFPNAPWCSPEKMLISWKVIYNAMYRYFNYRQLRYRSEQTHYLIINEFIDKLPGFHTKQIMYIEENFKKLFDVDNLGEMVSVNNLVKQTQSQKQLMKSISASAISPHAFTDALSDMSISDATQTESESESDNDLTSQNDSQGSTKRLQLLDKLIQLSDTNFRLHLKDLLTNFENFFVRFQNKFNKGDEDIFTKLLEIIQNSENVLIDADKEKVSIKFELKNIEGSLSDLIDSKVALNKLEDTVSKTQGNVLQVDTKDNKLYVAKGQGTSYFGDEKTVHLDNKNTFSTIGISTGDEQFPFVSGKDIVQFRNAIVDDKEKIKDLTQDVETNTKNIQTNKDGVANNKKLIDENATSIKNLDDVVNNKCVKNDELNEIVVDEKDKPNNILQVLNGNKLYVPTTNVKWKIFATTKDFVYKDNYWVFNNPTINIKNGDALLFDINYSYLSNTINSNNLLLIYDKSSITSFLYQINNDINKIIISYYKNSDLLQVFAYQLDKPEELKICVWKLENALEIPPIPPTPTISKKEAYTFFKESFLK